MHLMECTFVDEGIKKVMADKQSLTESLSKTHNLVHVNEPRLTSDEEKE